MKIVCIGLNSNNATGVFRITGIQYAMQAETPEDEIVLQFMCDNPKGARFQVGKYEWQYSTRRLK